MNVLLDSDFIIALNISNQSTHGKAKQILASLHSASLYITNFVKAELVTVASKKFTVAFAHEMYLLCNDLDNIWIDEIIDREVWNEFRRYKKKSISYVDCANLVVARQENMKIASFDRFYPKEILI